MAKSGELGSRLRYGGGSSARFRRNGVMNPDTTTPIKVARSPGRLVGSVEVSR